MRIHDAARKHGISADAMLHAVRHPLILIRQHDDMLMVIGADSTGQLLEIGLLDPEENPVIVHAMVMRQKLARYL